eukprot:TRINITY_DN533_c0_g3_i10.p1 TRINITY_DN533_c0_g3~~TRINITY_DN533_c0_g3_i10.p1  ORF type:complete len:558 (+),score=71.42 TRINITY_DN533_c0_g3_i10:190-1674(+)
MVEVATAKVVEVSGVEVRVYPGDLHELKKTCVRSGEEEREDPYNTFIYTHLKYEKVSNGDKFKYCNPVKILKTVNESRGTIIYEKVTSKDARYKDLEEVVNTVVVKEADKKIFVKCQKEGGSVEVTVKIKYGTEHRENVEMVMEKAGVEWDPEDVVVEKKKSEDEYVLAWALVEEADHVILKKNPNRAESSTIQIVDGSGVFSTTSKKVLKPTKEHILATLSAKLSISPTRIGLNPNMTQATIRPLTVVMAYYTGVRNFQIKHNMTVSDVVIKAVKGFNADQDLEYGITSSKGIWYDKSALAGRVMTDGEIYCLAVVRCPVVVRTDWGYKLVEEVGGLCGEAGSEGEEASEEEEEADCVDIVFSKNGVISRGTVPKELTHAALGSYLLRLFEIPSWESHTFAPPFSPTRITTPASLPPLISFTPNPLVTVISTIPSKPFTHRFYLTPPSLYSSLVVSLQRQVPTYRRIISRSGREIKSNEDLAPLPHPVVLYIS